MTILTVKNQLVTHFLSNDTFSFAKHSLDIEFDKEVSNFREDMIKAACSELELLGLIKRMGNPEQGTEIWVLVQPLNAFQQNVVISPLVADVVASYINHYNELEKIDAECDKTKIDESDILRLCQIIENYETAIERAQQLSSKDKKDEDEEEDRK